MVPQSSRWQVKYIWYALNGMLPAAVFLATRTHAGVEQRYAVPLIKIGVVSNAGLRTRKKKLSEPLLIMSLLSPGKASAWTRQ